MTYEEILKAYKNLSSGYGAGVVGDLNTATLELLKEQKAEIERLKQSNKNILFVNEQVIERNEKLQKQVDELTKPIGKFKDNEALQKAYESLEKEFTRRSQRLRELQGKETKEKADLRTVYHQAVKDTAKEIYGLAVVYYDGSTIDSMFFNELEERYGVEVE